VNTLPDASQFIDCQPNFSPARKKANSSKLKGKGAGVSKEPRRKRRGFKRLKKPIWVAGIEPATQIAHSSPPQAAGHPERFRER